ncbi:MAG: ABC transporter permease [Gemmatimonadales bacterium]
MLNPLLSEIRFRLRALFRRDAMEHELDAELQFHLHQARDKLVREGLPPDEAMRQARIALGGVEVVKESTRESRGIGWLERVGQDLRYAVRSLRRNPLFTTGVVLTLGLGIGVNAAMFDIVDRLLFRTPAYLPHPDQVHRVYLRYQDRGEPRTESHLGYTRYLDLRNATTSFSELAAFTSRSLAVGTGGESREMPVSIVSATVFRLFDAPPVLGRVFTTQEDTVPAGTRVAVLGYAYWQTAFGGRTDVLGQPLHIGTWDFTIIGVAPRGFSGPGRDDHADANAGGPVAFIPITAYAAMTWTNRSPSDYYTRYNWNWMEMVVRRKPEVSLVAANADLSHAFQQSWNNEASLSPSLAPVDVARPEAIAGPVQHERGPLQSTVTKVAGWVSGVAVIVLLIACANVANLLLARSIRRRREIAVRLALGVSRRRLVMQLLTESLLLAACGGVTGLLLSYWGGAILRGLFLPSASVATSVTDGRVLAFALAVTALAGGLTGLAPVLQTRRPNLAGELKAGIRDGGQRRSRLRTGLLLLQATLSVVLLIGAGLFVLSLRKVQATRLGFDVDPVLYINLNMRGVRLGDTGDAQLRERLVDAARVVPGVERATLGLTVPFWDTWVDNLFVSGIDSVERLGSFTLQAGSPDYFATMGTRILQGRGFTAQDAVAAPRVAVVSQAMAQLLWPGRNAVGECMRVGADTMPCTTVVGISEDAKQESLTSSSGGHYYLPIVQYHPEGAALFVRMRQSATGAEEQLRRELQPLMPGDAYVTVTALKEIVGGQIQSWRLGATMFLAFGGLALVLAAIGLYSVIAYDVAQRTHELGVRIALGARVGDVMRLVVGDGLRIALLGVAIGGIIALWAGRWIAPLLYEQSPRDPLVFGAVTGVLLGVALLASAIPALRASRVNPNTALRSE